MANPDLPPSELNEIRQLAELRNPENVNDLHRENSAESGFPTMPSEMMQIVEDTVQIYRNACLHAQEAMETLPIGDPHRYVISAEYERVRNEVKKIELTIDLALERRGAREREERPKLRRAAAAQNQVAQGCHRAPWKVAGRTGLLHEPTEVEDGNLQEELLRHHQVQVHQQEDHQVKEVFDNQQEGKENDEKTDSSDKNEDASVEVRVAEQSEAKRGRGRPRKPQENKEDAPAVVVGSVKRGPGRPRKQVDDDAVEKPMPKRPRGRPPKSASNDDQEQNAKRRGSPRKIPQQMEEE